MPSEKIKNLKDRYENGPHKIGRDLVKTCLEECKVYRRGTAYFGSSALRSYAGALGHILKENVKIEILCSPVISDKRLVEILKNNSTPEKRKKTVQELADKIVLSAIGLDTIQIKKDSSGDVRRQLHEYRSKLLAFLIAKGQLEIRFAILSDADWPVDEEEYDDEMFEKSDNDRNLYHVKKGYFVFADGSKVAFNGSFNETDTAHNRNIESAEVYKSWQEHDETRLNNLVQSIDDDWESKNPYIEIYNLSEDAIKQIRQSAPTEPPRHSITIKKESFEPDVVNFNVTNKMTDLRPYQKEALIEWEQYNFHGIFAMATGSGKTRTSIKAIEHFRKSNPGGFVLVLVPYKPLAYQWIEEIKSIININSIPAFESYNDWYSELKNICFAAEIIDIDGPVIVAVNKTFKSKMFQELMQFIKRAKQKNNLIIVDECHHYNGQEHVDMLPDFFTHRLGLSATPYDQFEDNPEDKFLEKYFGKIVFEYTLRQAIDAGFLCPYIYKVIEISLDEDETEEYEKLTLQIARTYFIQGGDDTENRDKLLSKRTRLLGRAKDKLFKLENHITSTGKSPFTLVYCGDGMTEEEGENVRQIEQVSKLLNNLGWNVGKITCEETSKERERTVQALKSKMIDVIVSIQILDEGIDIPSCQTAFLLASKRSERVFIQRRGRVLRLSENKEKALIYDFVITSGTSKSKAINRMIKNELQRVWHFAKDALNKDEILNKYENLAAEVNLMGEENEQ